VAAIAAVAPACEGQQLRVVVRDHRQTAQRKRTDLGSLAAQRAAQVQGERLLMRAELHAEPHAIERASAQPFEQRDRAPLFRREDRLNRDAELRGDCSPLLQQCGVVDDELRPQQTDRAGLRSGFGEPTCDDLELVPRGGRGEELFGRDRRQMRRAAMPRAVVTAPAACGCCGGCRDDERNEDGGYTGAYGAERPRR